jgi:hypothetical protein
MVELLMRLQQFLVGEVGGTRNVGVRQVRQVSDTYIIISFLIKHIIINCFLEL